jgi:hypothetical protein
VKLKDARATTEKVLAIAAYIIKERELQEAPIKVDMDAIKNRK